MGPDVLRDPPGRRDISSANLTPKGLEKKAALTAAAIEVLLQEGIEAVSHRAVAQRAGSSLASTTYYFADLRDLVHAAVGELTRKELDEARGTALTAVDGADGSVGSLVNILLGTLLGRRMPDADDDRHMIMLRYERLAGTGRRPYLADVMAQAMTELNGMLAAAFERAGQARMSRDSRNCPVADMRPAR